MKPFLRLKSSQFKYHIYVGLAWYIFNIFFISTFKVDICYFLVWNHLTGCPLFGKSFSHDAMDTFTIGSPLKGALWLASDEVQTMAGFSKDVIVQNKACLLARVFIASQGNDLQKRDVLTGTIFKKGTSWQDGHVVFTQLRKTRRVSNWKYHKTIKKVMLNISWYTVYLKSRKSGL